MDSASTPPPAPDTAGDARYSDTHPGVRYLLLGIGWLSIALGVAGIFLPILPTTPFILLAAWCFARSSKRFHDWLLNHRRLGPIVHTWQKGEGLPRRVRNRVLVLLWFSLLSSCLIVGKLWLIPMLVVVGAGTTTYLLRQPVSERV